ncbi:MAG: type II toxin-antitoxin system VapC family toxin [Pseudomonadota bacterium]
MKFWDSSAILPLLVAETCSPAAIAWYQKNPEVVAWWATPIECTSALTRLEREASLDAAGVALALRQLALLQAAWHEVQPLDVVRQVAQRLLRLHPLRAADSLQLAAALVACEHRPQHWQFVCLDARLGLAAEREGFSVLRQFAEMR